MARARRSAKLLGIARIEAAPPAGSDSAGCLFLVHLDTLADADIDAAASRLAALKSAAGIVLQLPPADDVERFGYAVKRLSSIFRSGSAQGQVALETAQVIDAAAEEELAPYVDALVVRPGPDGSGRIHAAPLGLHVAGIRLGRHGGPGCPRRLPAVRAGGSARGAAPPLARRDRDPLAPAAVPHRRRLARPDRDAGGPQGRLVGRGAAALRREEVHARAAAAGRPRRCRLDRARGRPLRERPRWRTSRAAPGATSS